ELPARGVIAGMTGRTLAMIDELGFDLQPAGWRLTDAPGVDHRRAKSLLAQDLDAFEELTQDYEGPLKIQVAGPWTLAATTERPRGDRILADIGARREVAEALALGVAAHIADVRKRVPGAQLHVQVDEPALPAVMRGSIPTASGFHRHRSIDAPRAAALLELVFQAITTAGATSVAHCCADTPPLDLFRGAGAQALSLDVTHLAAASYEPLGSALDARLPVYLGVVGTSPVETINDSRVIERTRRLLGMIGFDAHEVSDQLILTPACGLANANPAEARMVMRTLSGAARGLAEG
ncbi:MAG TPA: methionine synthase, partial [Marmoricola sp.]|nr:methionine synthase [Marmoricola sp.]